MFFFTHKRYLLKPAHTCSDWISSVYNVQHGINIAECNNTYVASEVQMVRDSDIKAVPET